MTSVVRCSTRRSSAACTSASLSASKAEVASSRSSRGGSWRRARAMATRCFWPPERRTPRSPTRVSYPSWKRSMNSCAFAWRAAASTAPRSAKASSSAAAAATEARCATEVAASMASAPSDAARARAP
mmetsp:Transcript_15677/g.42094  ORF Transcript_15677/g.42094 Transcript_15677/m.42094 type:complete len:128 (-) Transcript_15677:2149-2532(-)